MASPCSSVPPPQPARCLSPPRRPTPMASSHGGVPQSMQQQHGPPPPPHLKLGAPLACLPPARPLPQHPGFSLVGQHLEQMQRAHNMAAQLDLRFRYSLALQQTAGGGGPQHHPAASLAAFHHHHQHHQPGAAPPPPGAMHDPAVMAALLYGSKAAGGFGGMMDPRVRFFQEEPKPSQSYIGLISMALLSSKEGKLILGDIYQWILDNYPYFRNRGPGWRNSIRHNLSLNDCFIKAGRAANGKGHYWAIHPANMDDFKRGDFRRRRAQRKVRKAMGLEVPDEEESPSPPPPGGEGAGGVMTWRDRMLQDPAHRPRFPPAAAATVPPPPTAPSGEPAHQQQHKVKRGFDMESLLAPDTGKGGGGGDDDSGVHEGTGELDEEDEDGDEDEVYIDVDSTEPPPTDTNQAADGGVTASSPPQQQQPAPEGEDGLSPPPSAAPWSPHSGPWTPVSSGSAAFFPNPFLAWPGLPALPAFYAAAAARGLHVMDTARGDQTPAGGGSPPSRQSPDNQPPHGGEDEDQHSST